MSYFHGAAASRAALLTLVYDFATADGWTVAAPEIYKGAMRVQFAYGLTNRFSYDLNANFDDYQLEIRMRDDILGGGIRNYVAPVITNDMAGPFPNVWIFSNEAKTCINVIVQTSADRFASFGFGTLDNREQHAEALPYCVGTFYWWWRHVASAVDAGNSYLNQPQSLQHNIGWFADRSNVRVGFPDGLLDPTLTFVDGPHITTNDGPGNSYPVWKTCDRLARRVDGLAGQRSFFLDFFTGVDNQAQTGGIPLSALPVFVFGTDGSARAFLGEFPDIRLVNMNGLAVQQTVTFADDDWVVFPIKQVGSPEATVGGIAPTPVCNSVSYGLALRKVV